MDTREFNKRLKKITVLYESICENNAVSPLEQDLMLSYIRDLYEVTLAGETMSKKSDVKTADPVLSFPVQETVAHHVIPEERPVFDFRENPNSTPVVADQITTPQVKRHDDLKSETVVTTARTTAFPDLQAMAELFQEAKVTDLSDKLANTPIKDLQKGMGINEKIFTIQELFSGNQEHFNKVISTMNECANFNDAKSFMMEEVIPKYDWTSESKIKKAVTFIRMVKRRFI
jgi:hypothetical protein